MPLSARDRDTLRLAVTPFRYRGELENVIRERFDESGTRFWQRVYRLVDMEDALAAEPVMVNNLRRLRDRRIAERTTAHV